MCSNSNMRTMLTDRLKPAQYSSGNDRKPGDAAAREDPGFPDPSAQDPSQVSYQKGAGKNAAVQIAGDS